MLAMDDNVNAYCLNERVVWSFFSRACRKRAPQAGTASGRRKRAPAPTDSSLIHRRFYQR